ADKNIGGVKALDRLHAGLFLNYDRLVQPQFESVPTPVSLGLVINYIDIEEINGKLTVHCYLNIGWKDENLTWQPSEYENITQIIVRSSEVWTPQITLFNGDEGGLLADTQVLLGCHGQLLRVPPAVYTAYCNLNMQNWPQDEQTCTLQIGSWGLKNIVAENVTGKDTALDYDELVQSPEWEIVGSKAKFVSQDFYGYMEYTLTAKRRSSMYTAVIYTPASCIVILALAAFWLPPHMGGEKIMINGLLIIVIAAFLMYFAQLVPVLSNKTPLVGELGLLLVKGSTYFIPRSLVVIFYSTTLLLLSVSTIIEVAVLYLATVRHKRRIPDVLRKLLHGKVGTWLLLSHFCILQPASNQAEKTNELYEQQENEQEQNVYENVEDESPTNPLDINPSEVPAYKAIQFDWALLATAVDRVFFVVYSLAFLVLAIVCAV
ncbi:hypothetical protein KR032_005424, partial [Drosophila birchii]